MKRRQMTWMRGAAVLGALGTALVAPFAGGSTAHATLIDGARSLGDVVKVQFPGAGTGPTTDVHLLGFNDFHGNLDATALSPSKQYGQFAGGVSNLVKAIKDKRATYGAGNVATVMAGDAIGASPLISAQYADEPAIVALDQAGIDFASVGNHEFDKGYVELQRLAAGCASAADPAACSVAKGKIHADNVANATSNAEDYVLPNGTTSPIYPGANFQYLSTNVRTTSSGNFAENTLFPAYGTKDFPSSGGGTIKVGFIGLTLHDTPSIVTPSGVAGLTFDDEVASANAAAVQLKALGAKTIVMIIHQGGFQSGTAVLNGCAGNLDPAANAGSQQIYDIIKPTSGLDTDIGVIISGHTHVEYVCTISDGAGHTRLITSASAFGRVLTDATLTISNDTGELKGAVAANAIVSSSSNPTTFTALPGDPTTSQIVSQYKTAVAVSANQIVGRITSNFTNTSQNPLGEMTAGDLVADAQLAATAPADKGGAQIAFMNPGGVRSPGLVFNGTTGNITYSDAFTMQPFYNYLVTKTLSGAQIRSLLEQQYVGCGGQATKRILLVSSGFRYETDPAAVTCAGKIGLIQLNGSNINPAQNYRVTLNNFLYTGGDGFTVFAQAPRDGQFGEFDIDALVQFMAPSIAGAPLAPIALSTAATVTAADPNRIVSIGQLPANAPTDVPEAPSPVLLVLSVMVLAGGIGLLTLKLRRRTA
jgi:5'-nucleotidase